MPREIIVFGAKTFKFTLPDEARLTFSPWSPPSAKGRNFGYEDGGGGRAAGTLRIYKGSGDKDILACFSGVTGFRDMSLNVLEQVTVQQGDTVWKDDGNNYSRQSKEARTKEWRLAELPPVTIEAKKAKKSKGKTAG